MGEGASFVLGPPKPLPHGRGDLLRFGTTEAPTPWARGPPSLWDQRDPRRMGEGTSFDLGPPGPGGMGEGASFAVGPPRPPSHGSGDPRRIGEWALP